MIPGGHEPPVGTGPMGLGGGMRWKSVDDVVAYNSLYSRGDLASVLPLSCVPPPTQLRPYQIEAVESVYGGSRGCVLEVGCGLGKTFIGSEIIRRRGTKAVVVCQHNVGVTQFVDHLRGVGFHNVATAHTDHRLGDPIPDVVVLTYHTVVRVGSLLSRHAELLRSLVQHGKHEQASEIPDRNLLVFLLHVLPLGTLILDEVHVAVADHFRYACCLRHDLVVGMSGSLIREDMRLQRLESYVGTTTFRYFVARHIEYYTARVDFDEQTAERRVVCPHRSKVDQAIRACHPNKLRALLAILQRSEFSERKSIVFCDSPSACKEVALWLNAVRRPLETVVVTGSASNEERDAVLTRFAHEDDVRCLLSTRVCDSGVDLPDGTLVIQLYQSCGSRQQEVQRAGRGTRDMATDSTMVHIVNRGTEEEEFMERRIQFVQAQHENTVTVVDLASCEVSTDEELLLQPMRTVASLVLRLRQNRRRGGGDPYRLIRKRLPHGGPRGDAQASQGTTPRQA